MTKRKNIITKILNFSIAMVITSICNAQTTPAQELQVNHNLVDTISGKRFVLDSTRRFITAIGPEGDTLWRNEPSSMAKDLRKGNLDPRVVYLSLGADVVEREKVVLWIRYDSGAYGIINMHSGRFECYGMD